MADRILFTGVAMALLGLGICMLVWPRRVALNSRDADDQRPVTTGELWTMRGLGVALVAGSIFFLHAIWTGVPGVVAVP